MRCFAGVAALIGLLLAGCSSAPAFKAVEAVPPGQALVYIYFAHGALMPKPAQDIYVNGQRVVALRPGRFFVCPVPPGPVVVSSEPSPGPQGQSLDLNVSAGRLYLVEWVYINGFPHGSTEFRSRDLAAAADALGNCVEVEVERAPAIAAAQAPAPFRPESSAPVAPVAAPVSPPPTSGDQLLSADCPVIAPTDEAHAAVSSLIEFLRAEKPSRDFDQITRIEFSSADRAALRFTWWGGAHSGAMTVERSAGAWRIVHEQHEP